MTQQKHSLSEVISQLFWQKGKCYARRHWVGCYKWKVESGKWKIVLKLNSRPQHPLSGRDVTLVTEREGAYSG